MKWYDTANLERMRRELKSALSKKNNKVARKLMGQILKEEYEMDKYNLWVRHSKSPTKLT